MTELWVWNDETKDYQVVTKADPDVIIYDRPGESMFLKGELPFVQICPNPLYDYYWGASEVQRLVYLQQLRNKRMTEILGLAVQTSQPSYRLDWLYRHSGREELCPEPCWWLAGNRYAQCQSREVSAHYAARPVQGNWRD
jgi:hypothetical protein